MPRRVQVTVARVLVSLLLVAPAWSWGSAGHHIIAIIAEQRLSPAVREKIRALLMGGKYSIVDISTCADQLRSNSNGANRPGDAMCQTLAGEVPPTNGTWHYIDIPVPTQAKTLEAFCPQGDCVTAKIASFAETLRTSTDEGQRRQALLFLVHLVGDVHQPLHTVERACDKGGNSEWVGFSLDGQHSDVKLHQVWDSKEIDLLMADYNVTDEHALAEALIASISPAEAEKWTHATPEDMAWESYKIAVTRVYPAIPFQDFCGNQDSAPIETDLSLPYEEAGTRVVQLQLMKAGVRLAAILESALAGP
jgi:nuclease S1